MAAKFPDDVAGGLYADLISSELQQERDRKSSLEQRGMAVVTAAGTLVTLVFGFTTFLRGQNAVGLSMLSEGLFVAALFFFVGAALAGILSNRPFSYQVATEQALERLATEPFWSGADRVMGARRVAELNIAILAAARRTNNVKAQLVIASTSCLALAALLLAATAAAVAVHGS